MFDWKDTRYGFGYDSVGRDYKIVKISLFQCKPDFDEPDKACFQVYSLTRKSWTVQKIAPSSVLRCEDHSVVLNNRLHWLSSFNNNCKIIVTFDLHNEDFGEMAFPTTFPEASWFELLECSGCLYMTVNFYSGDVFIWAMKEYGVVESWTKKFQMNTIEIFGGPSRVVTYRSSREEVAEVLFLTLAGYELVWYNIQCQNFKKVFLPENITYNYDPYNQWECIATFASIDSLLD